MFLPQSRRSIQDRQHPTQRPAALLGPQTTPLTALLMLVMVSSILIFPSC